MTVQPALSHEQLDALRALDTPTVCNALELVAPERVLARRVVKARKGDTLASIAKRHGLSAKQVVAWNEGRAVNAKLKVREAVTLMLPAKARTSVAKGSTKKPTVRSASAAKKKPVRVAAKTSGKTVR